MDLMLLLLLLVIELVGGITVPYMNLLCFERGSCGGEERKELSSPRPLSMIVPVNDTMHEQVLT